NCPVGLDASRLRSWLWARCRIADSHGLSGGHRHVTEQPALCRVSPSAGRRRDVLSELWPRTVISSHRLKAGESYTEGIRSPRVVSAPTPRASSEWATHSVRGGLWCCHEYSVLLKMDDGAGIRSRSTRTFSHPR